MYVVFNPEHPVVVASYRAYHHAANRAVKETREASTFAHKGKDIVYVAMHRDFHHDYVVHTVTRRSARNGKTFTERNDTPYYLSPSSETYWSA